LQKYTQKFAPNIEASEVYKICSLSQKFFSYFFAF